MRHWIRISLLPWLISSYVANGCKDADIVLYDSQFPLSASSVGGKAYNLHKLQQINGISVPPWFCLRSSILSNFLEDNKIIPCLKELDRYCENYQERLQQISTLADKIKQSIITGAIRTEIIAKIHKACSHLVTQGQDMLWAIRSSGCSEDSEKSSLAGLYDSSLNKKNFDEICQDIKMVWASSFNPRVIAERVRLGQLPSDCSLAVLIQKMIIPETAGVATSIELSTNYPGIEISANYGTGESVVGGEVSADKWLVHQTKDYILKALMGDKKLFYQSSKKVSGTKLESTPLIKRQQFSISSGTVLEIARQVRKIKEYYQHDIDTEFAIDDAGNLFFIQARPIVKVASNDLYVVDADSAKMFSIIARGLYSVPGVAHGTLRFIGSWQELTQQDITEHDIIVTYRASNAWSHYITKVAGLITKEGSPTAHPILLARERGIPCIIGIGNDFDMLVSLSGKTVTLDGINRVIYSGILPFKHASTSDITKAFEPVTVKPSINHNQRIKTLMNANQLIFHDGKYWLKTPTYPIRLLEQEINVNRFKRFSALLNIDKDMNIEWHVIDNFVCNIFNPFEEVVEYYKDMSLDACERFLSEQETNMNRYLTLTEDFHLNTKTWQEYVDLYTDLRAYIWLSGGFRAHIERMLQTLTVDMDLPQHYLEECYSAVQAALCEEDTNMQKDIHELASNMISLPEIERVEELKNAFPEIYAQLTRLGERYRFDHEMSIEKDLNLNLIYQKVLFEREQIKQGHCFVSTKKNSNEQFFPGNEQLIRLISFSIRNRINQSNAHHYCIRGQWKIRKTLLNLGQQLVKAKKLNNPKDILDCSIDRIANYIADYQ